MGISTLYELEQDEELRIEVDCPKGEFCEVVLKSGFAEIFGTELTINEVYKFANGAKFSVFTYHGCQVQVNKEKSNFQNRATKSTDI